MRFQVFLSLCSVTSWLCIDKIPEHVKTTKEIFFIKVKTRPWVGDMSKNSYHGIFHCPDDIDIISRYEKKNWNHILLDLS